MNKKLKFCPDCGTNIENLEGKFCPTCGKQVKEEENFEKVKESLEKTSEVFKDSLGKTSKVVKENSKILLNKSEKILKETFSEENKEKTKNFLEKSGKNLKEKSILFGKFLKNNKKYIKIIIFLLTVSIIGYLFGTGKINFGDKKENNSGNIENSTGKISSGETENFKNISSGNYIGNEEEYAGDLENEQKDYKNEENIEDRGIYKVISERAFFYDGAGEMSEKKSYLMKGDIVYTLGGDIFFPGYKNVCYYTNKGYEVCGWIKDIDLKNATDEEIKKDEERRDNISEKTTSTDKDTENKDFLISHYQAIENKNYYTAFHNYQYPKAKNVDDFASWYKGVYEINLSEIETIGKNEYRYVVYIYSDTGLNKIETSIKVGKVDGKLKILGYGTKKVD